MAAGARRLARPGRQAPAPPGLDLGAVASGVIAMFVLTLILSAGLAAAIYFTDVTEGDLAGVLYYAGVVTVAAGGAVAGRRAETRGWLHGGLAGVGYVLVSLAVGSLLFPGAALLAGLGGKLATAFAAGAVGGVVGVNL